jgi:hypothetical protein
LRDFYSAAAQVLPVLVLAIVLEYRAMTGSGPNVYEAFGLPTKMTAAPRWFLPSYLVVLVLMPASFFAGEAAALHALSLERPGRASCYWTIGGLALGGIFVLLPFVLEGFRRTFVRYEVPLGEKMRVVFLLIAVGLAAYWAVGLVVLFA